MTTLLLAQNAARRDDKLGLIASTPIGEGRTRSELEELGRAFELTTVAPGTVLQRAGVRARWWGVVVAGRADVFAGDMSVGQLQAGQAFGAGSIAGRRASTTTVVAGSALTVLLLDGRRLLELTARFPHWAQTPDADCRTTPYDFVSRGRGRGSPVANRASRLFPEDYAVGARTGTRNEWGL